MLATSLANAIAAPAARGVTPEFVQMLVDNGDLAHVRYLHTYMALLCRGTLHRFDSVTEMVAFCRTRYPGAEVRTTNARGEFVLEVDAPEFESLIVHFEGSRCYAVLLPSA